MPSARKMFAKWARLCEQAPPDARYEVGLTWDERHGWRVYQRVGDAGLAMDAKHARGLLTSYQKLAQLPQWKEAAAGLMDTIGELGKLADECDQKNKAHAVPPEMVAVAPVAGHA